MLQGYRPSIAEASRAFCCYCLSDYSDGRKDCEAPNCEMYVKHKFRTMKPNFEAWLFEQWGSHERHQKFLGLTKQEYIKQVIGDDPYKIGYAPIFRAMCFWCCGNYRGHVNRFDCNTPHCPIYFWMPYRTHLPSYDWMFDFSYPKRHRINARTNGYIIKTKNVQGHIYTTIDRNRYIEDNLTWYGDLIKQKRQRRIHAVS